MKSKLFLVLLAMICHAVYGADMALYPTGPSQDSAFVRFVNGTEGQLEILASGSKSKVALSEAKPSTTFFPIAANKEIKGQFVGANLKSDIALTVKPGEFVSAIAVIKDNKITPIILRETPEDFNSLKASVSLYNLAAQQCAVANLAIVGKGVNLVENVDANKIARRSINPLNISVELSCNNVKTGLTLNLGNLQAGKRYTVFALPGAKKAHLNFVEDTLLP
jgi:hypothetical protein